jgi:hypothetical protein
MRRLRTLLALVLMLNLAATQAVAAEDRLVWDAREVTDLAKRLRDRVEVTAQTVSGYMPQGTLQQRNRRDRARRDLARVQEAAEALLTACVKGWGPDQIRPLFDRVREEMAEVREFRENARPNKGILLPWLRAQATAEKLAAYFAEE